MARLPYGLRPQRRGLREPYDRVLIVTEGQKTEPQYFAELVTHYRINTANVRITPSTRGSDPLSVVNTAVEFRNDEERLGERYDRVYCVFDRDSHANFCRASERARREDILVARSWPCFEYWLLLHYELVRSPFGRTQTKSPCEVCIDMLRLHLSGYRKADQGVFSRLAGRLEQAKAAAKQALADAESTEAPNPSTEVHTLVEYLQRLKARPG